MHKNQNNSSTSTLLLNPGIIESTLKNAARNVNFWL